MRRDGDEAISPFFFIPDLKTRVAFLAGHTQSGRSFPLET
jgi:hypothetical protein